MIREMFLYVFEAVLYTHKRFGLIGGHDTHHALRVAEMAYKIAIGEWNDEHIAKLAALAGLCHNADRVIQKKLKIGKQSTPDKEVENLVIYWLGLLEELSLTDRREIISTVLKHECANSEQDSNVLIALRDADRVVNLELDLVIRSGQHYHKLPAVDFEHFIDDPSATYQEPRSVLRDIAYALEWMDEKSPYCIRTSLGRKFGEERATELRRYTDTLRKQLEETGLLKQHKQ